MPVFSFFLGGALGLEFEGFGRRQFFSIGLLQAVAQNLPPPAQQKPRDDSRDA